MPIQVNLTSTRRLGAACTFESDVSHAKAMGCVAARRVPADAERSWFGSHSPPRDPGNECGQSRSLR
jgi:hypothetical protein